jgi:hydroxymethylglutaryl-CoA reductase
MTEKEEMFSNISGFYKLSATERAAKVAELRGLTPEEADILAGGGLDRGSADGMIENVVGLWPLPLGIAVNFRVNGKDYLVPMAIEEPSVVAAASNSAKVARLKGGFSCSSTDPVMIGQIQVMDAPETGKAVASLSDGKQRLLDLANEQDPTLVKLGGGARDIEIRELDTRSGKMLVLHLLVDCRDAMGANTVNTMCEALAPMVEELTGGRVLLRILSNLATHRLVKAVAVFPAEAMATDTLTGEEVVDRIIQAQVFAEADPFRCATHNKGVMNGVDAVVRATGNDTRAVEAGYHAYCALQGEYRPMTTYEKNSDGDLVGTLEMPMAVGLVGGSTKVHPVAQVCLKVLGVDSAKELGEVVCAAGLAQNHAALRALATVGIQKGHMGLHARNVAVTAGAPPELVDKVVERLVAGGKVRIDIAKEIIEELKEGDS